MWQGGLSALMTPTAMPHELHAPGRLNQAGLINSVGEGPD